MPSGAANDSPSPIDEMEELLLSVAGGSPADRSEAIVYSRCRSALLQSPAKHLLPGFVYQCLTIFKFKEFITLYDPDPALRQAFVRRAIGRCRSMMEGDAPGEPAAPPAPDKSDPRHWMS